MRVFLIILRVLVLLTALVGAGTSGGCGYRGWQLSQEKDLEQARKAQVAYRVLAQTDPNRYQVPLTIINAAVDIAESRERVYPFLLAGAVLGVLAGVFAMMGYTTSAGVLLLVTGVGPGFINWPWLLVTCPLIAAGFGSLFVSFLAFLTAPKDGEEPEEEDEERPRTRPKGRSRDEEEEADDLEEVEEEVEERVAKKPAAKRPVIEEDEEEEEEPPPPKRGAKRK